ncbi:MAG TPA: ComEA family DNA-binding protein [Acidobacteriota bacterium]|nr:ComEA family DNA-binding protein [Acidobacteriota bacterium]
MQKAFLFVAVLAALAFWNVLEASDAEGKVNINTASLEQLDTLPGVGPAIAARIIDYRTKNGPFRRLEDIMNVRGIGEKKFWKMKARLAISGTSSETGKVGPPPRKRPLLPPRRK